MFESISMSRQDVISGASFDLGLLAECLVFYQKVRLFVDAESFKFLIRMCGSEVLLELLDMGVLEIEFFDNMTGIRTFDQGTSSERHDAVVFTTDKMKFPQVAHTLFEEIAGPSGKGYAKLIKRFSRHVSRTELAVSELAKHIVDFSDQEYVSSAVRSLLGYSAPDYKPPDNLIFAATVNQGTVTVRTNIDFAAANDSFHKLVPKTQASLSTAFILGNILDTRREIELAAQHSTEVALAPTRSVIAACKFEQVVERTTKNVQAMNLFQEVVVPDSRSIREVVNVRERTFEDVLKLVQAAQRFREWVKGKDESTSLREEYCREVSRLDWADKLPPKALRWFIMTGAGFAVDALVGGHIGSAGSVALSAADSLIFDKLLKGWRPNQFIEGPLKKFLQTGK